ncbi:MAG: hypothetical protein WC794_05170 [Candidatus Doudnabacteria bacterium]|jgi:hypothetical protein
MKNHSEDPEITRAALESDPNYIINFNRSLAIQVLHQLDSSYRLGEGTPEQEKMYDEICALPTIKEAMTYAEKKGVKITDKIQDRAHYSGATPAIKYKEPREANPEEEYSDDTLGVIRHRILVKKFGEKFIEEHNKLKSSKYMEEIRPDLDPQDPEHKLLARVLSEDDNLLEEVAEFRKRLDSLKNARDLATFAKQEGIILDQTDKQIIAEVTEEMISADLW